MNWADYAVLGVIAVSVIIGLWRGLVSEVMALVIWIAAFWVAWAFGASVSAQFRGLIQTPSLRVLAGYGLCFLAVLLLGALVRFVISRLVESTGLTGTDRLLGMLFGLMRGVLVVILVVFVLGFTPLRHDSWWRQSVLIGKAQVGAGWLVQRLPENLRGYLKPDDANPPLKGVGHVIGKGLEAGRNALIKDAPAPATSAQGNPPAATSAPDTNTE